MISLDKLGVKTDVFWPENSISDVYLTLRPLPDKMATPIFKNEL